LEGSQHPERPQRCQVPEIYSHCNIAGRGQSRTFSPNMSKTSDHKLQILRLSERRSGKVTCR
ncbi:hypothetical protein J6590_056514, partial [Homalodisca vitripennis]